MTFVSYFIAVHLISVVFLINAHLSLFILVLRGFLFLLKLYNHMRLIGFILLILMLMLIYSLGTFWLRIVVVLTLLERVFNPLLEHEKLLLVALTKVEL
jgi:hypothetical protein